MIARRELLLGALALSACAKVEISSSPPAAAPTSPPELPPLPPFDEATYARRREHLRALTREAGADLAFVSSGTTAFRYVTGARIERSERLIALVAPLDEPAFVIAPSFEVTRVSRGVVALPVHGWEEQESPYVVAARALRGKPSAILVEPHVEYPTALAFAAAVENGHPIDGTSAFAQLRLVKEEAELARMRRAVAITQRAFEEAFAQLREGDRDLDVSARIHDAMVAQGADDGYALVQFAALSALPHGRPAGDRLARGSAVLIDGGAEVDGYWSDVTRTRWFGGEPPEDARRIHALVHDAQSRAIERVRPGVVAQEIDRAARGVIAAAGFGGAFTHRTGHGLGMDGHEPIYMVEGDQAPLVAGCVFTVEPGIYLPQRFGVRIEDDVLCGPSGAVVLSTRAPRELAVIDA